MIAPAVLIGAGAGALVLLALAIGLAVAQGAAKRRGARLAAVLAPHQPAVAVAVRAPAPPWIERAIAFAAKLVGLRRERMADHPVAWWVVLLVALIAARAAAGLGATLLDARLLYATPLLWLVFARQGFGMCEQHRLAGLYRQLPDALAMIVRAARVGIPVGEAIRAVGRESAAPTAREFTELADRLAIGVPLNEALATTVRRSGLAEYGFFATALILQAQTGGALSETLDNLAEVIRRRVALRARARALASEARASALILVALPVFAAGALFLLSPGYVGLLVYDPGGQRIAAAAIGMILAGALAMRQIIRSSLG